MEYQVSIFSKEMKLLVLECFEKKPAISLSKKNTKTT